jgi:hypothetical protein
VPAVSAGMYDVVIKAGTGGGIVTSSTQALTVN